MNKAQKKIVRGWVIILLLIITVSIYSEWLLENWDSIKFPILILIIILVAIGQQQTKKDPMVEGRFELNRIIEENFWLKIYYVIYTLLIAATVLYISIKEVVFTKEAAYYAVIPLAFVILPIFIIQQKEAYSNAGKKI